MTALNRITPPSSEPLTLAEAKAHLRVSTIDDDTLISGLITATRNVCEEFTARALITQGWRLWLDRFPGDPIPWWDGTREGAYTRLTVNRFINIPRAPLQSISAVTIYGDDDSSTLFSPTLYFVDNAAEPGRLALRNNASWPIPMRMSNGISVDFTAGYGAASAVPQAMKQGMLVHIGQLYEHRGEGLRFRGDQISVQSLPDIVQAMYQPFRIQRLRY
ncbi:MAG: head-tail connector protein [Alphaproteobacteria bacterium]|nr:head-tail connector protein [Alphaproteobacteria bacterium]